LFRRAWISFRKIWILFREIWISFIAPNAATGAAIGEPLRHEGLVNRALYSPNLKRVLSWSYDQTLKAERAAGRGRSPPG
jgi:hypothetical protein